MAELYLDHNVDIRLVEPFKNAGHGVRTAYNLGIDGADDPEHLAVATDNGWILLTNDKEDFRLLHLAFQMWARRWHFDPQEHAGIIVMDGGMRPTPDQANAVITLLASGLVFRNTLWEWRDRTWKTYPPNA